MPHLDPLPSILMAGSFNLLAGASGVGKTALIAWLARSLRDGTPIFGHPVNPVPGIGYIAADRPWADAQLWFDAVGFPDIKHYSMVDDFSFDTARLQSTKPKAHAKIFESFLEHLDLPDGSVVFADPVALFLGGDLNHYIRCAIGCINLYRLILPRNLCVIGVVHSGKQKGEKDRYVRLQDRLSGSMAQLGYTGTQMYLASPQEMESSFHTFHWNPHHARPQDFQMKQSHETGLFDPVEGVTPGGRPTVGPVALTDEDLTYLRSAFIPDQTHNTADLLARAIQEGLSSRATLFRRLERLVAAGRLSKVARGSYRLLSDSGAKGEAEAKPSPETP